MIYDTSIHLCWHIQEVCANWKANQRRNFKVICRELQMNFDEVKNRKTRLKEFVYARQLYAYFCKKYTNDGLTNMGKFINKDHATMIYSIKQIKGFYEVEKVIKNDVDKINTILKHKVVNHTANTREKIGNEIILKYQS